MNCPVAALPPERVSCALQPATEQAPSFLTPPCTLEFILAMQSGHQEFDPHNYCFGKPILQSFTALQHLLLRVPDNANPPTHNLT